MQVNTAARDDAVLYIEVCPAYSFPYASGEHAPSPRTFIISVAADSHLHRIGLRVFIIGHDVMSRTLLLDVESGCVCVGFMFA